MQVILSTRNPSKVEEVQAIFAGSDIQFLTLAEAGIGGEAVEDGKTLEQNAFKKSWFAREQSDGTTWVAADDTGLAIDALGGEPGVLSARWAGENATEQDMLRHCLARIAGLADRSASFTTVVAAVAPDGTGYVFTGAIRGHLLEQPPVPPWPKMPYGALFVPEGHNRTLAQMAIEECNALSHRGQAFRKLRTFLESYSPQHI